jgi:3-methyladenine DNA glycosylase AlkC
LPEDYQKAVSILLKALPSELDSEKTDNDFGDFIYAPYNDFVAAYGRGKKNLKFSLKILREITKRFSAEDAIRFFINDYPREALVELTKWSKDKNYHVRRLCSEGTRPKLPWSQKIVLEPGEALQILDNLFFDKTRYVTRSVANHLNDISKIDPQLVITTLKKWQQSKRQDPKEMEFITKHALRTLVKQGNTKALALLGFHPAAEIQVKDFCLTTPQVKIGEVVEFSFTITAKEKAKLAIDYIVYFQSKNGTQNNKKVHKIKVIEMQKGEVLSIDKKHPLRANMTTRTLYPGKHALELQINGQSWGKKSFTLL